MRQNRPIPDEDIPRAPRSSAPVSPRHHRTNKVRPRMLGPARHGPPHQSLPDITGQTKSDLECSALCATVLRTSLYPTFPDKQSPTSNARPCAPRSSAPVSPRHHRTNKVRPRALGPARHGLPHQPLPDNTGQTKSDLECSALRATVLRTSLSPTSPDKQSPTSNARPCAPRSSAPVSPRHHRTNKVRPRALGPARHGLPHQPLPDNTGQTKSDLERSVQRATVLRTSLSPTSPDKQSPTSNARLCAPRSSAPVSPRQHRTNKVRPRVLGAARLARTRVPSISPLTRGNECLPVGKGLLIS